MYRCAALMVASHILAEDQAFESNLTNAISKLLDDVRLANHRHEVPSALSPWEPL